MKGCTQVTPRVPHPVSHSFPVPIMSEQEMKKCEAYTRGPAVHGRWPLSVMVEVGILPLPLQNTCHVAAGPERQR